jgi:tape measure domain-containing protein
MPSVDNRVVRMEFDNATFEAKIKQTLTSLGQLDKALKLEGAHKGMTDINAAAGRVNLGPIQTAVQSVSASFLALSTIAITALSTITQRALSSAAQISSAFTLDPIMEGFREFELQMGSIQTILANTARDGTNLSQVGDALNQLNAYADQTIYNFGQMTRNIGTFTAAGVDLQTSVDSIKGISNLAAISGSSAEQAATAMYQLSQAVSTGTLRLIDWNSVVNAGMGGEVFQRALFETGVAMGTIVDAPVGTTFEEWTAKGNSFRDSLESGWLTSEVLTNTLKGFTGDMTEAQLLAIGYTKEQAAEILKLGQTGVEAATKVRTLTGLMSTLKEGLASGWAASFRIILGDFEEATKLFTGLSNSIGGFFSRQAEARNAVLQGWADLGGRAQLLQGLEQGFFAIGRVLSEVGKAFRDVFPATTAQRLLDITKSFSEFTASLRPSERTIENVRRIFTGLFSALDLGWTVIKEGVGFLKDLIVQLLGLGSGNYLQGAAGILDFFTNLRESLDGGDKIKVFFDNLTEAVQKPIQFIHDLKDAIFDFFEGLAGGSADAAGGGVDRISQRFEGLSTVLERLGGIGDVVRTALEGILTVLQNVGDAIIDWFQELGTKLAEAIGPGEFDAVLDALNVSLLGGIGLLIANFLRGGINFDVGNGFFGNISEAFGQLTSTLEAMQTSIRADALLKIAAAVGILAAAMVALSLIDSAALTRALIAMAVGFGQLMASFAILNTMNAGLLDGATFAAIAAGMVVMSTAVLILAGAVAVLAQLSWGDLARGLTAVTALLGVMSATAIIISKNAGSLIAAGIGISAMAVAINILAGAVALFSRFSWSEMVRGFAGVAAGLLLLAGAAHLMPPNLVVTGAGLILIATALNILAVALKSFSQMSWSEMGKGLAAIAGGLLIIAGTMHLMPPNMIATAAALVLVGVALNIIAKALSEFGGMSWSEMGKGLAAMAGALLILAIATNAMTGALSGAAAILVVSVALGILAKVLAEMAEIPFGDLVKAIGGIAIALAVFGAAAALLQPVIPALLGLGVALLLIGGAFALFGVGALAVAKAFELIAEAGPDAADAIVAALEAIGAALPALVRGFAEGIVELITVFVEAAPVIAEALGVLLVHIIDTINELIPKIGELLGGLIDLMIDLVTEKGPDLIEAGITLILNLLQGIRDNIGDITEVVIEILDNFLTALAENMFVLTDAGTAVLVAFILGITENLDQILAAVQLLVTTLITGLGSLATSIVGAGFAVLTQFLSGIGDNLADVVTTVGTMITTFITAVGDQAVAIATAGTDALIDFLEGITNNLFKVTETVGTLITTFITSVANEGTRIVTAGSDALIRFIEGIGRNASRVVTAGVDTVIRFIEGIGQNGIRLAKAAADVVIDFLNALAEVIRQKAPELRAAGLNIAAAIADGITGGLASKAKGIADSAVGTAKGAIGAVEKVLGISSPSKVFIEIGQQMGEGMIVGLSDTRGVELAAEHMGNVAVKSTRAFLKRVIDEMRVIENVSPTITPVLDLTKVRAEADEMVKFLSDTQTFVPPFTLKTAQLVATSPRPGQEPFQPRTAEARGINFQQIINSPEQLSAGEIYKQTRNQITLAKEELDVP